MYLKRKFEKQKQFNEKINHVWNLNIEIDDWTNENANQIIKLVFNWKSHLSPIHSMEPSFIIGTNSITSLPIFFIFIFYNVIKCTLFVLFMSNLHNTQFIINTALPIQSTLPTESERTRAWNRLHTFLFTSYFRWIGLPNLESGATILSIDIS